MSESEWEYATDKYKEFRKSRQMKKAEFKEHKSIIAEGKFSKSLIDKAIKIAKKSSGQMTKAFTAIEKLAKGLGDDPTVSNALRLANEQKYIPGETKAQRKVRKNLNKNPNTTKQTTVETVKTVTNQHNIAFVIGNGTSRSILFIP